MHRTDLLQALADYASRYPEEASTVDRFTQFVHTHPDCFERSLPIGHVTGSAWVVNPAGSHVLLTHHRKLDAWFQLGGHADGDANVHRVAQREAEEESGLEQIEAISSAIFDIDIHPIPARGSEAAHYHYDVRYTFRAVGSDRVTISHESNALAWFDIHTLPACLEEASLHRMARKWLNPRST